MNKSGADGDTVKLLKECDAGIKMGVSAIDEVMDSVKSKNLKGLLNDSKNQHEKLKDEIITELDKHGDEGKNPNPMAKGMSWIKTNVMLAADDSDNMVADLITDGCNMGVKSLSKYLNQYQSADNRSKDITKRLVQIENTLAENIREYL